MSHMISCDACRIDGELHGEVKSIGSRNKIKYL